MQVKDFKEEDAYLHHAAFKTAVYEMHDMEAPEEPWGVIYQIPKWMFRHIDGKKFHAIARSSVGN